MKIITGNTGGKHITSEDDGALYASIIGKQDYILDMNDKFGCEVLDTNTIKINSGDALLNGRQVRIPKGTYDTVSIDNGQAGYNRIDLIVIRYETDGVIEQANIVAIKGTPTTSDAVAPEYQSESILDGALVHDVPLYEVHLNGINLESVEKVFTERDLNIAKLCDDVLNLNAKFNTHTKYQKDAETETGEVWEDGSKIYRKVIGNLTLVAGINTIKHEIADFWFPLKAYGGFTQQNDKFQIFPESCCNDITGYGISIRDFTSVDFSIVLGTEYVAERTPKGSMGHIVLEYVKRKSN